MQDLIITERVSHISCGLKDSVIIQRSSDGLIKRWWRAVGATVNNQDSEAAVRTIPSPGKDFFVVNKILL